MNLKEQADAMMVAKARMVDDAALVRVIVDPDAEFAHKWEWTDEGREAMRRACRTVLAERRQEAPPAA